MRNWMIFLTLMMGLGIISIFPACQDDEDLPCYCADEGIILGEDPRDCACCGGWFIEIEEDTLRALYLPQEFAASLEPGEFPLPVFMEWEPDDSPCLGDEIVVTCIRRR